MIEAVFFDLDNTLLQNDGDQFLEDFTTLVGRRLGVSEARFVEATMIAGAAVMGDHPDLSNHGVMVRTLADTLGLDALAVDGAMRRFGPGDMAQLGLPWARLAQARTVVLEVMDLGLKCVLATSPIYLAAPIRERMRRAGVDDLPWDLITTSDRMHSAKPATSYFTEAARLIGCTPQVCLMVGDNAFQDLPARKAGLQTYFVGERLTGMDMGAAGSLDTLVAWLEKQLERCS